MATETFERKLAAIVAADVVGYSRLMGADEAGTLARLKEIRQQLVEPKIIKYHGRIVKLMGDGILIEFPSVVDALVSAIEVQRAIKIRNQDIVEGQQIVFRIGINLGDIMVEGHDIYGDGVNIAARLEPLAEPGGICISQAARDAISNKLPLEYRDIGVQQLKNITEPVRVYQVKIPPGAVMPRASIIYPHPDQSLKKRIALRLGAALLVIGAAAVFFLLYQPKPVPQIVAASEANMAFPLPSEPSIAVLPFMNLSDDTKQGYFADAISNDIITDLSKFSTLFVVAANSTFRYKGKPVKVQQVAEDLGVRYVLEGSIQRLDENLRINAQLIDALSGQHVWAERYDRDANDLFAVQDEITRNIVGIISPVAGGRGKLQKAELERIAHTPTENLEAYDYFLRGIAHIDRFTKEDNELGRQLLEKAIALDPGYGRAIGKLVWTYLLDYENGWGSSREASLQRAMEVAKQAVAADPNEAWAYWGLASAHLFQKHYDLMLQAHQKAYELNPKDAAMVTEYGWGLSLVGQTEKGITLMQEAMRLDPYHPSWYWSNLGVGYFLAGQYEESIASFEKIVEPWGIILRRLVVNYALLGNIEKAQAILAKYLELEPQASLELIAETAPYRPADLERFLDGLRKAGMPEEALTMQTINR